MSKRQRRAVKPSQRPGLVILGELGVRFVVRRVAHIHAYRGLYCLWGLPPIGAFLVAFRRVGWPECLVPTVVVFVFLVVLPMVLPYGWAARWRDFVDHHLERGIDEFRGRSASIDRRCLASRERVRAK